MKPEIAAEKVAAGGKWLDQHAPEDWLDLVDLERLDIGSSTRCVLGQVFASRAEGGDGYFWVQSNMATGVVQDLANLGFTIGLRSPWGQGCLMLNEAWKDYIVARRVAAREAWVEPMVDDLAVSIGQMRRGEGVPARTAEEEEVA